MSTAESLLAVVAAGYVLGSIPVGYLVSRWRGGVDIRQHGSGNVGATNVTRTLGMATGLAVLAGDAGKGALAAALGSMLFGPAGAALGTVMAMVGHAWPVFLRFSGGKSVATGLGGLAVTSPWIALALLAIWAVVLAITRYVSVSSVVAAASAPLWAYLFLHDPWVTGTAAAMAAVVAWRHTENLRRLLRGVEHRFSLARRG